MSTAYSTIQVLSLSQLSKGNEWRLNLVHDQPHHLLVWITRGHGVGLIDGLRRGLGAHNALFVPAGSTFALDLARQSTGQAVLLPVDSPLRWPEIPRHLRIREVQVQSELTGLVEAALREEATGRPLHADAMEAYAALMSVWLRRQIALEEHIPEKRNAAGRLSKRFCEMLPTRFRTGDTMAQYAADLGVTPTHLTRAVKSATGKTAADLLAERVLYDARRLLVETTEPANAIASFLGFGSAAYFTRFIQQHTGAPPSKLRGNKRLEQTSR